MELFHSLADTAFIALQVLTGVIGGYQVVLAFFGLVRKKEEIKHQPEKTFAILVAAHNEAGVIGPLIDNLQALDYPKEMYDVYVICDNCTDNTADIVREKGAIAMERNVPDKRGKGHAIEWMLDKLWKQPKEYDAVVMFDADNLTETDFLRKMNDKFMNGARVVQAYLDTKNPGDSWISISYAISYWYINRMWQLARYNMGLVNYLAGTGMVFESKLLKEIGWGATSLTEDIEFTVRCVERGIYPTWAHDAIVYDEKPITLKASMRQRLRWMQGHFDCAERYSFKLFKKSIKERNLSMFDAALFLFQPIRLLIIIFTTLMMYLQMWMPEFFYFTDLSAILPTWFWIAINVILYGQLPLSLLLERAPLKGYLGMFIYPIFVVTWFPIAIVGFFTRKNTEWSHTVHTRSIRVEEISR